MKKLILIAVLGLFLAACSKEEDLPGGTLRDIDYYRADLDLAKRVAKACEEKQGKLSEIEMQNCQNAGMAIFIPKKPTSPDPNKYKGFKGGTQ